MRLLIMANTELLIEAICAFNDNYIWALRSGDTLCVVDPGDAAPVINYANTHKLKLDTILITHHHNDHIGGVEELRKHWPEVTIFGPQRCIKPEDMLATDGDYIDCLGLSFRVIDVPGHTLDHIAYFCDDASLNQPALFCGDTLFAGGCGRLFEGTAAQMFASLQKLAALPSSTLAYCAHEYTLSNLRFALAVEPENSALQNRIASDSSKRDKSIPTVPSTLQLEIETNPFLRCHSPAVYQAAKVYRQQQGDKTPLLADDPVATFAAIRDWKNRF
jgi:hydroxyacylglutathione hydrolase